MQNIYTYKYLSSYSVRRNYDIVCCFMWARSFASEVKDEGVSEEGVEEIR